MTRLLVLCLLLLGSCSGPSQAPPVQTAPAAPKITQFYSGAGIVTPGEPVIICYGVENAKTVRIEPAVEALSPSYNRCIQTTPKQSTTYTLTAEGDGPPATAQFEIKVDPKARRAVETAKGHTLIQFLSASATTIPRGAPVTVCYGVRGATSVSLKPAGPALGPEPKACVSLNLTETTTLTLTAKDAQGREDSEKLKITVQ